MDPITVVGVVASITQFVDLGCKIVSAVKEIRESADGWAQDDRRTADVIKEMQSLSKELENQGVEPGDRHRRALCSLAAECHNLSREILGLFDRISAKNPKSWRESTLSSLRKVKYKKHREELERKLDTCRSQLHIHLAYVSSQDLKERLISLARSTDTQSRTVLSLDDRLKELQTGISSLSSFSQDIRNELQGVMEMRTAMKETLAEREILRQLHRPDMHRRFGDVEGAHVHTYKWLLEEGFCEESNEMAESRELLCDWLHKENGVFHIAGKLGCGKSVLMKFILNHKNTICGLRKWSSHRRLAVAHHFFWRPGSTLQQNSLGGMIRSLLHGTLNSCPELIRIALPREWKRMIAKIDSRHTLDLEEQTTQDDMFLVALNSLFTNSTIHDTHRFCFFIDALDELEGKSPQNDHRALVDLLKFWVDQSQGSLKILVSSREDNVFMNAFKAERRLKLQDLTRRDMERFIQKELQDLPEDASKARITYQILQRSHGIFLWVSLVVKRLRQCIEDGLGASHFEAELALLPEGLEGLFKHLLESIPKTRRRNAGSLFVIARLRGHESYHPLPIVLHLDEYLRDPDAFIHASAHYEYELPLVERQRRRNEKLLTARKMLYGDCRGLIESRDGFEIDEQVMVLTHRSVTEFLDKAVAKDSLLPYIQGFELAHALPRIMLAHVRAYVRETAPREWYLYSNWLTFILDALSVYDEEKSRDENYEYINMLESALQRGIEPDDAGYVQFGLAFLFKRHLHIQLLQGPEVDGVRISLPGRSRASSNSNAEECTEDTIRLTHPCYLLAYLGKLGYAEWILRHDPTYFRDPFRRSLLLAYFAYGMCDGWSARQEHLRVIERLMQIGHLKGIGDILAVLVAHYMRMYGRRDVAVVGQLIEALLRVVHDKNDIDLSFEYYPPDEMLHMDGTTARVYRGYRPTEPHTVLKTDSPSPIRFRDIIPQLWRFSNRERILALIDWIEKTGYPTRKKQGEVFERDEKICALLESLWGTGCPRDKNQGQVTSSSIIEESVDDSTAAAGDKVTCTETERETATTSSIIEEGVDDSTAAAGNEVTCTETERETATTSSIIKEPVDDSTTAAGDKVTCTETEKETKTIPRRDIMHWIYGLSAASTPACIAFALLGLLCAYALCRYYGGI